MKHLIVLLLSLYSFQLSAQHDFSISAEAYQSARTSIFLLKNEYAKIPLSNTDALAAQHFSSKGLEALPSLLNLYFPIDPQSIDFSTLDHQSADTTRITLLSLDLASLTIDDLIIQQLEKIVKKKQTITLVFDSSNAIKTFAFDFSKCSHLFYIAGRTKVQQSLTVQALFGGISIDQKLPQALNTSFGKGQGYTLNGGLRLAYTPPELVGIDRTILQEGIGKIAQNAIDSGAFPGCQVLVIKDQKVIFHEVWGYHTYDQNQAVRSTDIYDFASITKITSALPALMKLHGEGKLGLNDPLEKYFPAFKKSNKADLRIRPILAHHARLKPWIPYWRSTLRKNGKYKWRTFKKRKSRRFPIKVTDQLYLHHKYKKRIYKAIKASPLNEKAGYTYSGLAFYLWPEIVESLVNVDFETYLKSTFYQPLGASTITYNPDQHFSLDRIVLTENDTFFRKVQIHGKVHDEGAAMMGGVSANAGLFGSANDLAKLMQLYLNRGTYGGERFIEAGSVDEFTRCQYCPEGNRRGLGFDKPLIEYHPQKSSVAKDASPASYGHSGYTGTFTWVDPEHQLIYIFFANRVYPTRENRKIYQLNVRPDIHQVIYDSFLKSKLREADHPER